MRIRLDEMSHAEAGKFDEVILPTGSIEQHGLHLPLGTDSMLAESFSTELAVRKGIAVCPPLVFGFSGEHSRFPGTIDIGLGAFTDVVERIVSSLLSTFGRVYIINYHGGNSAALEALVKDLGRDDVYLIHFWRAAKDVMDRLTGQDNIGIEHAGEFETSFMLATRPDLVGEGDRGPDSSISIPGGRIFGKTWFSDEITETGAFGGAVLASAEKGRAFIDSCIDSLSEIIDEIRRDSDRG